MKATIYKILMPVMSLLVTVSLYAQTGKAQFAGDGGQQQEYSESGFADAELIKDFVKNTKKGDSYKSKLINHTYYTAEWNCNYHIPNYVMYVLMPFMVTKDGVSRTDEFQADPLAGPTKTYPADYSQSGYDRGHMMPAADCKFSETAMTESFYMTNVCPQNHKLNEGPWCDLEKQVRFWCKYYYKSPLWVACGPLFYSTDSNSHQYIGYTKVAVPDAFWKVVCRKDGRTGRFEAIAFIFPNDRNTKDYKERAVSVDEVERLTGLDFYSGFEGEDRMEAGVNVNKWKF